MADEVSTGDTMEDGQPKSAKQLAKEALKAAKLEKLKAKLDKKVAAPVSTKEKSDVSGANLKTVLGIVNVH